MTTERLAKIMAAVKINAEVWPNDDGGHVTLTIPFDVAENILNLHEDGLTEEDHIAMCEGDESGLLGRTLSVMNQLCDAIKEFRKPWPPAGEPDDEESDDSDE